LDLILKGFIAVHLVVSVLIYLLATPNAGMLLALIVFPVWVIVELGLFIGLMIHVIEFGEVKASIKLWLTFILSIFILYSQSTIH
jgi:hypothetical protein